MPDASELLSWVWGAGATATVVRGARIHDEGLLTVDLRDRTRVDVQLDPGGLYLVLDPGLHVRLAGGLTSVDVGQLRFSFEEGRFHVTTAGAPVVGAIRDHFVDGYVEHTVKDKLPPSLRAGNYSPKDDPDLAGTIAAAQAIFPAAPSGGGAMAALENLEDPSGWLQISVPSELRVTLTEGLELLMPAEGQLYLSLAGTGRLTAPRATSLKLEARNDALSLRSTGDGIADAFARMIVRRVSVVPGGAFQFEYDLPAEELLSAGASFLRQIGVPVTAEPEVTLTSARASIDAMLQKEVPPRFRDLLSRYDRVVPGLSLVELLA
jgi:hypothetical protein